MSFGVFTVQLNSTVATGGDSIDFSSYFSSIQHIVMNAGTDTADFSWIHGVLGTANATVGGLTSTSALKMITYYDKASSAGTFPEAAAANASGVDKLTLLVFGVAV
jgi:hypothetical protein